jgi:hypothetical protein
MRLVALIDPMVERCAAVLAKKRAATWLEPAYRDTMVYKTVAEYAAAVANAPEKKPRYALLLPSGIQIAKSLIWLEG